MKQFISNPHAASVIAHHYPERVISVSLPTDVVKPDWVGILQEHGIAVQPAKQLGIQVLPINYLSESAWLDDLAVKSTGLWLALDGVTDPHNLGACLRTMAALGAQGLILPKHHSVSVTEVARNIACGGADLVPIYQVTNLAKALASTKSKGAWVYGSCERGPQSLSETKLDGKIIIVMGSEGKGMRDQVRKQCDVTFHLPTKPPVLSLNVSVATGMILHHCISNIN